MYHMTGGGRWLLARAQADRLLADGTDDDLIHICMYIYIYIYTHIFVFYLYIYIYNYTIQ